MGVFTAVLTLPLAPVRGVVWVADQAGRAADRELRDPAVVRARLAALNEDLENGVIDEEEFEREEDRLLDLLFAHDRPDGPHGPPDAPHTPPTGAPDGAWHLAPGEAGERER
jgi:hypothetical protein